MESKASIEERLALLVQEPSHKSVCDKLPMKIFVIFSLVLFAGGVGVFGYFFVEWQIAHSDVNYYGDKIISNKKALEQAEKDEVRLEKELKETVDKYNKARNDTENYRKNNTNLISEITHLNNSIEYANNSIHETIKLIAKEVEEYKKLDEHRKKLDEELIEINKVIDEIMIKVNESRRQLAVWKIGTGIGFFGSALTAISGFSITGQLASAQKHIKQANVYKKSYGNIVQPFENYHYLSNYLGRPVSRELCYSWKNFGVPDDCLNKENMVVTITTSSGYRFGVIMKVAWYNKYHNDTHAKGFSSNSGKFVTASEAHTIDIVTNSSYFQFGKADIIINLNTGRGSSMLEQFHDPDGNRKFFTEETDFVIEDLTVHSIHL